MASESSSEFRIFSAEQLLAEIHKDSQRTTSTCTTSASAAPASAFIPSVGFPSASAVEFLSPIALPLRPLDSSIATVDDDEDDDGEDSGTRWGSFLREQTKVDPRFQLVPKSTKGRNSTNTSMVTSGGDDHSEVGALSSRKEKNKVVEQESMVTDDEAGERVQQRKISTKRARFEASLGKSSMETSSALQETASLNESFRQSSIDSSAHSDRNKGLLDAVLKDEDTNTFAVQEEDLDKFWSEGCAVTDEVWKDKPKALRTRSKKTSPSSSKDVDDSSPMKTRLDDESDERGAKSIRGRRLFAAAAGEKVVTLKTKQDQESRQTTAPSVLEEDDIDDISFDIRPKFTEENVAAGREGDNLGPLVLDDHRLYQVHSWANRYLRQYQRDGVKFMFKNLSTGKGAVLNDDMGLGKTVQVVSLCLAILGKQGSLADKRKVKERRKARALSTPGVCTEELLSEQGTILIVAPKAVMNQWGREMDTWGYFDWEDLSLHDGDSAKLELLSKCRPMSFRSVPCNPEVLLVPYPVLARSPTKDKEKAEVLRALFQLKFRLVVFDEVHMLKNLKSNMTTNARKLQALARIGLTGTMMQNNLTEFWTVLTTIQPNALGSLKNFNDFYAKPIKRARTRKASQEVLKLGQDRAQRIRAKLDTYLLRRTKKLIESQLPKKKENVVFCKLTEMQKHVYERIANGKDATLLKRAKEPCDCGRPSMQRGKCCHKGDETAPLWSWFHPSGDTCMRCPYCLQLPMISKLINCCNHVDLLKYDPLADSKSEIAAKVAFAKEAFGEDVETLGGFERATSFEVVSNHEFSGKLLVLGQLLNVWRLQPTSRVLVFSHYTRILDIIGKYLDRNGMVHCRIDGSTPSQQRVSIMDNFNNLDNRDNFVFLISTKAGGLGLNLTAANIVVLFDSSWNPSFDVQAQDRAYRLGQRRDVDVYRLISTGTIEDKTYCRQLYKLQLSSEALEGNAEERYFEGIQGDRKNQGELWGVHNLVDYNPEGHLAALKRQYNWQSAVPSTIGSSSSGATAAGMRMSAATRAAIQAGSRSGFMVETVGDVKPSEDQDVENLEDGDELGLDGSTKRKGISELNDLAMAQLWLEAYGIPVDADAPQAAVTADCDNSQATESGKKGKRKAGSSKRSSLVENLTRIVESGQGDDFLTDEELFTEDDENGAFEIADDPVEDDDGQQLRTDDEEDDHLTLEVIAEEAKQARVREEISLKRRTRGGIYFKTDCVDLSCAFHGQEECSR